jgi:uncharacterized membrane protein
MEEMEQRLQRIEARLAALEQQQAEKSEPVAEPGPMIREAAVESATLRGPHDPLVSGTSPWRVDGGHRRQESEPIIGSLLGWGGATALVLAASYLIRLAVENGWLTPTRQVAIAALAAFGLIAAGLLLRRHDRSYAAYLPAGGIVILFMTIYGAHLYYPLIGVTTAIAMIIGTCLLSLWHCRLFDSQLYAFFAVLGSYSAPFMFPPLRNSTLDLAIYFSAWSALFSAYAVIVHRRTVLLLALYLALVGFDLIWRMNASEEWLAALAFQFVQLLIFAAGTAACSMRWREAMPQAEAIWYLPALLIFYILQYSLLQQHIPAWAPWIAFGSALVPAAAYLAARLVLRRPLPAGELLVTAYVALVLFHAGYLESVPAAWGPWVALVVLPAAFFYGRISAGSRQSQWPVYLVSLLIFLLNCFRILTDTATAAVPGRELLYWLYPASIYLAWYLAGRVQVLASLRLALLYAGHIGTMAAAMHAFDDRLLVSLAWAVLAIVCLLLALRLKDRLLGQSSLLIFAASAGKLLLYDLAGSAPLVRIASLVVLGISFYLGGWLYRRLEFSDSADE